MPARISSRSLVERRAELEALERALERAADGDPTVTLVIGEAGIGKSRLLREAERHARDQRHGGAARRVPAPRRRRAAVRAAGGAAARRAAGARSRPRSASSGRRCARELERAFPHLGAGLPVGGGSQPDRFAQARVFEAIVLLLGALGRGAPLLLVLEDVHWVDRSTREFVRFLVRGLRRERLAVAISFRTGELGSADPVREMLAELQYHERVTLAELAPLGREGDRRPARGDPRPRRPSRRSPPSCTSAAAATRCSPRSCCPPTATRAARSSRRGWPTRCACGCGACPSPRGGCCPTRPRSAARRRPRCSAPPPGPASPSSRPRCATPSTTTCSSTTASATRSLFRHDVVREAVYADLLPGERAPVHGAVAAAIGDAGAQAELAVHWRAAGDARAGAAGVGRGRPGGRGRARVRRGAAPPARRARAVAGGRRSRRRPRPRRAARPPLRPRPPHGRARAGGRVVRAGAGRCSTGRRTRRGRRASSSGSAACSRSRTTAASPPTRRRCGCCPTTTAPGARGCSAPRRSRCGRCTATTRRASGRRRRSRSPQEAGAAGEAAYARTVLGLVVAYAGQPAEGAAHLRTAIGELEGLGRPEDLLHAHLYLAESLRLLGDFEGALDGHGATASGTRGGSACRPRSGASWRSTRPPTSSCSAAGTAAEARLAELDGARPRAVERDRARAGRRASCALARGRLEEAERELRDAEALLRGRARRVPAGGVRRPRRARALAGPDRRPPATLVRAGPGGDAAASSELLYAPALFAMGARVEAEAALAAAGGRRPSASAPPRPPARLVAELDALVAGEASAAVGARPSRRRRAPRPRGPRARTPRTRGARSADAWAAIGAPYPAAYAGWRRAEAALRGRGRPRGRATRCAPRTSRRARSAPS